MAKPDFKSVDDYIASQPAAAKILLRRARSIIRFEISKGTIRFPLSQPVPVQLIRRIVKFRAKEIVERGKMKAIQRSPRMG